MSFDVSTAQLRPQLPRSSSKLGRGIAYTALVGIVGGVILQGCSSTTSGGGDNSDSSGLSNSSGGNTKGTATASNGGTSASNTGTNATNTGTNATNTGSSASNTGTNATNTGSSASNTGTNATNTGSSASNTGTNAGNPTTGGGNPTTGGGNPTTGANGGNPTTGGGNPTTGANGGIRDAGADSSVTRPDSGGMPDCTNTDMSKINIDASGWACNNKWGIQGAWYCYSDPGGSSTSCPNATMTGTVPYRASSSGMCLAGTTKTPPSAQNYGGGIGLVLSMANHDAGKMAFNAPSKNIIGFAITISGNTGGSILKVNFPPPLNMSTQEAPAVTIPGVSGTTTTYNVLFADGIMFNNTTANLGHVNVASINSVEISIPAENTAHTYDFCITDITPITAPPTTAALANYGPTFTEDSQVGINGLGPYAVQNDLFAGTKGMPMQVQYGNGQIGFTATASFGDTGNTPGAYPSIVYGWVHGGDFVGGGSSDGYHQAKTISSIASIPTSWSFTVTGNKWDAAYDAWVATSADPLSPGYELMVWLNSNGVQPIGGMTGQPITVNGISFQAYTGTNGTQQPVVSYLAQTKGNSAPSGFDLLPFFTDAHNKISGLSTDRYILGIYAGFEVYGGGTTAKTNSYSIKIN